MKKVLKLTLLYVFCLATFLLVPGMIPKSYAAAYAPNHPQSGGPCPVDDPLNTGISYDANAYTTIMVYLDAVNTPQPMGLFSFSDSNAPAISASTCLDSGLIGLYVSNNDANWYNLRTTVNGVTTQSVEQSGSDGYIGTIQKLLSRHQQYSFQVQSCSRVLWQRRPSCSSWSPTLQLTTATDSYCQDGYVWREAAQFDHVCVTPDQRSQAAYDNSQASSRVDPLGAYGSQSCVNGYVWREAFGGDYVCVTPAQRSQTAYDNSQAIARIVAF